MNFVDGCGTLHFPTIPSIFHLQYPFSLYLDNYPFVNFLIAFRLFLAFNPDHFTILPLPKIAFRVPIYLNDWNSVKLYVFLYIYLIVEAFTFTFNMYTFNVRYTYIGLYNCLYNYLYVYLYNYLYAFLLAPFRFLFYFYLRIHLYVVVNPRYYLYICIRYTYTART